MINMTQQVKMTAPGFIPQFLSGTITYNKNHFYVTTVSLTQMYTNKYYRTNSKSPIHPFKVVRR